MAKTGRPRRNSIEAFAAAIDACIAAYEESDDAHDLTDYARTRTKAETLNRSVGCLL